MHTGSAESYKVIRMYEIGRRSQVLARGMTQAEAQAWCSDPETSSSTATSAAAKRRTARYGRWFDGWTKE